VTEAAPARIVYPHPPIVEVICQVNFAQAVAWSVATPGVLWKAIEGEYPAEPKTMAGVAASFNAVAGEFTVNPHSARFVFANREESRRLVANESCLSVNGLSPYEEWPNIASRFQRAIEAFSKSVATFTPESVSIRYINRIVIPVGELNASDYFTVPIARSHQDNAVIQGFVARSQSVVPASGVATTITFASTEHEVEDESAFILDIDLVQPMSDGASTEELMKAAEELHRLENLEFESSITGRCRELFHADNR
jgi:uncharacterized protein (TIGR04255 family)